MHAKIGVSTFRAPVVACRQSIPVARQPTDNDRNCESTRATRRKHSEALSKASIGVCDVLKSVGMHHQIKSTVWVWQLRDVALGVARQNVSRKARKPRRQVACLVDFQQLWIDPAGHDALFEGPTTAACVYERSGERL